MSRARDDRGAVAIMVAVMATLLLSMAALGVDLGNAYVQKNDVQKLTDFAALAGASGNNLPGTVAGTCAYGKRAAATDQAVLDVASYLGTLPWTGGPSAADLVDCDTANGEVFYGTVTRPAGVVTLAYDPQTLSVISPPRHVAFGFANVMGFDGTDVAGSATSAVGTPGSTKVVPSYAVAGCDWGQQTITDPANGHVADFVPVLASPTDTNIATLAAATAPNPSPGSIAVNPPSTVVTITGTNLDQVRKVGFFQESDGIQAAPAPLVVPDSALSHVGSTSIQIALPDAADVPTLTDHDGLWWVRVWAPTTNNGSTYQWSAVSANGTARTVPFKVGVSYLRCVGASNSGNYGTLKLPRTDSVSASWTPRNIAKNLQPPLSLHTYPGAPTTIGGTSTVPDLCDPLDTTRTVYTATTGSAVLRPKTNCVDTDTGLPANAVSAGLVEGAGVDAPGRLVSSASTSCSTPRTVQLTGNVSVPINNDVLTCFLQPGVTLSTIESPTYAGPAVLTCDVFDSPRFFYQPVLAVRPSSGGSNHYSIVDFRPAFITEQAPGASNGSGPLTVDNGVVIANHQVSEVDVVFFNNNALSSDCSNSVGPALGGTTKRALALVD